MDRKVIPAGSKFSFLIAEENAGNRVDAFLAEQFMGYSRSYFQKLIESGDILINNKQSKPSYKLKSKDIIDVTFPEAHKV